MNNGKYKGRIAPTPTGFMHRGHAKTFLAAQRRARERGGRLILRVEDLDGDRCRPEFTDALVEDLLWAGLRWDEGPGTGGPSGEYAQSHLRRAVPPRRSGAAPAQPYPLNLTLLPPHENPLQLKLFGETPPAKI